MKNFYFLKFCALLLFGILFQQGVFAQCQGPVPNAPIITGPSPSIVCPNTASQIIATEAGSRILWYDAASGGNLLDSTNSGATYTVTPSTTTTYYAEAQTIPVTAVTATFNFTGAMQTFTVPAGVTSLDITAFGAQGGSGAIGGNSVVGGAGALGGSVTGTLAVTPGDILNIFVGGQGATPTGGFNGGGNGGSQNAGGGGGASDIRIGGTAASDRVLVAGGGGGGGRGGCHEGSGTGGVGGDGGVGGGGVGQNGNDSPQSSGVAGGGKGGNFGSIQGAFGPAGIGCSGFLGQPGLATVNELGANGGGGQSCCCSSSNSITGGGGGGGGQIGGGGGGGGSAGTTGCAGNSKGAGGGGGGGSNFVGSMTNTTNVNGVQVGNGQIVIAFTIPNNNPGCVSATRTPVTVTVNPEPPTVSATPATICVGGNSNISATSSTVNSINWYDAPSGGNLLTTTASGANFNVTPAITTTYYASAFNSVPLSGSVTFNFTGAMQTFTVPAGVTSLDITAFGAQGGSGAIGGNSVVGGAGALGGSVTGTLAVTPGDILNIFVGGQGATPTGGFNGGGNGGSQNAGGGGGASDIRIGGTAASDRVLVAGGGGGGGRGGCHEGSGTGGVGGAGGVGGGGVGQNGNDSPQSSGVAGGGKGGNFGSIQGAFGPAGIGCSGFLGQPGVAAVNELGGNGGGGQSCCCSSSNSITGGGGGGGGQIGGGGGGGGSAGTSGCAGNSKGAGGGGGGGSNFVGSMTNTTNVNGVQVGDGVVTISWNAGSISGCESSPRVPVTVTVDNISVTATATPNNECGNAIVQLDATSAAATGFVWMPGNLSGAQQLVQPQNNTTYTVTASDANCSSTSTVVVTFSNSTNVLAPATSSQIQNHGDALTSSYFDASCNLIAKIEDLAAGGNILGLTTSTVNVDASAGTFNGQPFIRRWYKLEAPSNTGGPVNAKVTLYVNQSDFDNYNANFGPPYLQMPTSGSNADPNIPNIRITKNSPTLGVLPQVITPLSTWNGNYWELEFNVAGFSEFRLHSANPGNSALPVGLEVFKGRKMDVNNLLEWTTSSEQNNAYFNLQYCTDGISFKTLSKVNSKSINGQSTELLNYDYTHTTPALGHNYYRLEQADLDGNKVITSEVVDLMRSSTGSTLNVYPNPTRDVLNIDLYATLPTATIIKIVDMSGRKVKEFQTNTKAGMNKLTITMNDLVKGLYTIQVFEGDVLSFTEKVTKKD